MNPVRKIVQGVALSVLMLGVVPCSNAIDAIEPPANAGVDWRGPDNSTALHWAVYEENAERVRELIAEGADVNEANRYGSNAMQLAAEMGNIELLTILLDAGANVEAPNPEGQTALMLVARTGNVEAAELLVQRGANVNAMERFGEQTALMWASARRHPAMVDFLVKQGADINAQSIARDYRRHLTKEGRAKSLDSGGLTSLMYAIRENCRACVEVLISHGVDVDKPDPEGVSPLLLSIMNNHWDIAKSLLNAGADVQQWDMFGQAPLLAVVSRHDTTRVNVGDPLNETSGTTIMQMLLDAGANPNMQVWLRPPKQRGGALSRGTTPLMMAADGVDVKAMQLLLQYGARADHMQADLQTPVSVLVSARGNQEAMVEGLHLLVNAGAPVNIRAVPHHLQRTRGGTPLHYAVKAGNDKAVQTLVELGADINATDVDGLTALDHAMSRGQIGFLQMRQPPNTKMADLLRSLGATKELDVTPFWPNVGPPFYYPWSIFPLDPAEELSALVPGSFDHQ